MTETRTPPHSPEPEAYEPREGDLDPGKDIDWLREQQRRRLEADPTADAETVVNETIEDLLDRIGSSGTTMRWLMAEELKERSILNMNDEAWESRKREDGIADQSSEASDDGKSTGTSEYNSPKEEDFTPEAVDGLRAEVQRRLERPDVNRDIETRAAIADFLDERGFEDPDQRAAAVDGLEQILAMDDEQWGYVKRSHEGDVKQSAEESTTGDASKEVNKDDEPVEETEDSSEDDLAYSYDVPVAGPKFDAKRREASGEPSSEPEPTSGEGEASEGASESEKSKEHEPGERPPLSELMTPVEVLHMRWKQAAAYYDALEDFLTDEKLGVGNDPDDPEGMERAAQIRRDAAMQRASTRIEELTREHLAGYEDDPNYDRALEFLRDVSFNHMTQDEWLGDDKGASGMERADSFSREIADGGEEPGETGEDSESAETETNKEADEKTPESEEPEDSSDEASSEGAEEPPTRTPPLSPRERGRLFEFGRQAREDVERLGDELSALIAERMRKGEKFAEETQSEFDALYERYNQSLSDVNRAWVELRRDEIPVESSDVEYKEHEAALVADATKFVIKSQSVLRKKVRNEYLKSPWRKGVVRASQAWNHENKYVRWGTRLGFGAVATGMTLATAGGAGGFVGGTWLTVGAVKGAGAGTVAAFMRKSSKGPDTKAEGDFDFSEFNDADKLSDMFEAAETQGKRAMESATATERGARESARSIRNLGKGAAWGFVVGEGAGLIVNGVQTLWDAPSDISETVDRIQNRPSGAGAIDNSSAGTANPHEITGLPSEPSNAPSNIPSSSPTPEVSPSGGNVADATQGQGGGGNNVGGGNGASDTTPGGGNSNPETPDTGETSGGQLADQYADNPEAGVDISLNEGPYQTFDELGIPRSMWEELYKDEGLINTLVNNGDAYHLTDQGYGFGWSHTGNLQPDSIKAIYQHANMHGGNFDLAA